MQQQHFFEADVQQAAAAHNQQDAEGGQHAGDIHMPDALDDAGAVHDGGLVQLGGDGGQGGDVDDGAVAQLLPHAGPDVDTVEILGLGHIVGGGNAQIAQRHVDDAAAGVEELENQRAHNDGGNEVGRVADHLHRFAEALKRNVIQQQRENQRKRERGQRIEIDEQRVAQNLPELRRVEKLLHILEAHPVAILDGAGDAEIAERDLHAVHGHVPEGDQHRHGQQQHDIQRAVPGDFVFKGGREFFPRGVGNCFG